MVDILWHATHAQTDTATTNPCTCTASTLPANAYWRFEDPHSHHHRQVLVVSSSLMMHRQTSTLGTACHSVTRCIVRGVRGKVSLVRIRFAMTMTQADGTPYAISLASIQQAAKRLHGLAHRTPVLTCSTLDAVASESGAEAGGAGVQVRLFFKCENLQKVGAFKYRGATNAVKKVLETAEGSTTFVTQSSGNHAQAVALAARDTGCKAIIVMPRNAPAVKLNAVRGYGAQVEFSDWTIESREAVAAEWVERTRGSFIHPSNDADVMSGQGTAALELLEQVQDEYGVQLDAVIVPIGGGGLCAGTAMAVKSTQPNVQVFGVEPAGAADAHASHRAKKLMGHVTTPSTIADGLRSVLGTRNFPVIRDMVDDVLLVSENEIIAAMRLVWERMKMVIEPSGAVPVASVLSHKLPLAMLAGDKRVVNVGVIISGGNVDLDELPWLSKP